MVPLRLIFQNDYFARILPIGLVLLGLFAAFLEGIRFTADFARIASEERRKQAMLWSLAVLGILVLFCGIALLLHYRHLKKRSDHAGWSPEENVSGWVARLLLPVLFGLLFAVSFTRPPTNSPEDLHFAVRIIRIVTVFLVLVLFWVLLWRVHRIRKAMYSGIRVKGVVLENVLAEHGFGGGGSITFAWRGDHGEKCEGRHIVWSTERARRWVRGMTLELALNPDRPKCAVPVCLYEDGLEPLIPEG